MLRPSRSLRAAFTLIELLVVIAIIGTLAGLTLAGVMRVLIVRQKAETTARMTAVNNALTTVKGSESWGSVPYIPPGRFEYAAHPVTAPNGPGWYPFRLRNQYASPTGPGEPGIDSFEAKYLQRVFGKGARLDFSDLGYRNDSNQPILSADLDANATLTFFLGGIVESDGQGNGVFTGRSTNPVRPFIRRQTPDEKRINSALDLGGSKKYALYQGASGFWYAKLTDAHDMPFAYFAPLEGGRGKYVGYAPHVGGYNALPQGTVQVYSSGGQFENADGYQMISSGRDKRFGNTGNLAGVDQAGQDDQSNFTTSLLGAGKN